MAGGTPTVRIVTCAAAEVNARQAAAACQVVVMRFRTACRRQRHSRPALQPSPERQLNAIATFAEDLFGRTLPMPVSRAIPCVRAISSSVLNRLA